MGAAAGAAVDAGIGIVLVELDDPAPAVGAGAVAAFVPHAARVAVAAIAPANSAYRVDSERPIIILSSGWLVPTHTPRVTDAYRWNTLSRTRTLRGPDHADEVQERCLRAQVSSDVNLDHTVANSRGNPG